MIKVKYCLHFSWERNGAIFYIWVKYERNTFRIIEAIWAKDDINRWQIKQSFIKPAPSDPYHRNIQQAIGLTGFSAVFQTMREVLTVTQRNIASTFHGQDSR